LGLASRRRSTVRVNGREYRWPVRPLVVICLDGSSFDYIHAAITAGVAPNFSSLVASDRTSLVDAAMPTFTNPNNVSIITGVAPAVHGISGNYYFDARSGQAVMMDDASFLRAETILQTFSEHGASVLAVTAKHKLKRLLRVGSSGRCLSAEEEGQTVYSTELSEYVLRRGVELVRTLKPDLAYLSTSDYVQHACAPGAAEANRFYAVVDEYLGIFNEMGVTLVTTADHGMSAKTDPCGRARIVFLQDLVNDWFGEDAATVILPITDPYVAHHAALGSFATIYFADPRQVSPCISRLSTLSGVELALERADAAARFDLPDDRLGDIVVCATHDTVLGRTGREHDLSVLNGPLRSHGGLAEREVPMFFNRELVGDRRTRLRNYDAFWVGLNGLRDE